MTRTERVIPEFAKEHLRREGIEQSDTFAALPSTFAFVPKAHSQEKPDLLHCAGESYRSTVADRLSATNNNGIDPIMDRYHRGEGIDHDSRINACTGSFTEKVIDVTWTQVLG